MNKRDRQKIFEKYGGRCAYCGDLLQKGWHVDEIEPIIRLKKYVGNTYIHNSTGAIATPEDVQSDDFLIHFKWMERKAIPNGCVHPERLFIENQNPACASCNINKHSGSLEDFRRLISGFIKHLNEVSTQYKIAKRYGLVAETNVEVKFYFEKIKETM